MARVLKSLTALVLSLAVWGVLSATIAHGQASCESYGPNVHTYTNMDHDGSTLRAWCIVDVNRASSDELQLIGGIGPSMAERITAHRENEGWFGQGLPLAESLQVVKGIGPAKGLKFTTPNPNGKGKGNVVIALFATLD